VRIPIRDDFFSWQFLSYFKQSSAVEGSSPIRTNPSIWGWYGDSSHGQWLLWSPYSLTLPSLTDRTGLTASSLSSPKIAVRIKILGERSGLWLGKSKVRGFYYWSRLTFSLALTLARIHLQKIFFSEHEHLIHICYDLLPVKFPSLAIPRY
jgi:hypothetical protein